MNLLNDSRFLFLLGLEVLLVSSAGCGKADLAPVSGKVVFPDGTPLTRGSVVFNPADQNPFGAQGEISEEGTFQLGTRKTGEGVQPGRYRATIEPHDLDAGKIVDLRFQNVKTSGLEFTVAPGENDFTITVQRPGKKN